MINRLSALLFSTTFLVFSVTLTGCEKRAERDIYDRLQTESSVKIVGTITQDTGVPSDFQHGGLTSVFSNGGNYKTAIAIGEKIRAFGNDIAVVEQCLSSCAEFLLPAAKSIHAVNKPLIGFHKNPEILNFLKKSAGSNYCSDSDFGANEQRQFLAKMGKPTSSWRSILLRLDDSVYEAFNPIEGTCTTDKILYRHTMWYPTTTQLREIFGLRINGAVCADSYDCFSQKLRSKRKKTVVVGNEIYETGFSVKHVGRAKIK